MNPRRRAWTIWAISNVFVVLWILTDAFAPSSEDGVGAYVFASVAVLLYGTVGALITSRQWGNRVGLLFAWVALAAAVSGASGSYARLAVDRDLPVVAAATWVAQVGFAGMMGPLAFLFLIFPTGAPASRRWGWLLRVMLIAYGIMVVLFALTPGRMRAGFADLNSRVDNPIGLPIAWKGGVETLTVWFGFVVFAGALVSMLSLIQRFRRASTSERQQIRWLAFLGAFTAAYILVLLPLEVIGVIPEDGWASNASFFVLISLLFVGVPVTCAIAILKHGLWDLDVVVKKTVQYGVLLVACMGVIGLAVVLPGILFVGIGEEVLPGIAIGVLVTVVAMLLRAPARRIADRVVYGRRSTPYEVLSGFAERIGETYSTEDVLPRMAQLLREATGARVAKVWLRVGGAMRAEASWPTDAPAAVELTTPDGELPAFGDERAFEVRHQGELLGALTVTEAPDDPMTPSKEKLARDMAAQAGLVLRNVRLIEDLRESRRRIVAAQDERAKKLERNIHDGAQQHLVALQVKLRLAEGLVERDPAKARRLLEELGAQTTETLEDLRDLARGIYPPLLAEEGLPAALEAQARRSPVPATVEPDGVGRYGPDVESAVYFACLEALNNVAKYADASHVTVRLEQADGELCFEVVDDGRGFDPAAAERGTGLQGIQDRLDAVGGRLDVVSAPGRGTTLSGWVPTARREAVT